MMAMFRGCSMGRVFVLVLVVIALQLHYTSARPHVKYPYSSIQVRGEHQMALSKMIETDAFEDVKMDDHPRGQDEHEHPDPEHPEPEHPEPENPDPEHEMPEGEMDKGGMSMWFHFSDTAVVLFKGWDIDDEGGLILSTIGLALISALYEALKFFREVHQKSLLRSGTVSIVSAGHFIQTILHMIQIWIGMCLMLVFMTYNVWLCLGVTVGGGLGYFLFSWKRSSLMENKEICH